MISLPLSSHLATSASSLLFSWWNISTCSAIFSFFLSVNWRPISPFICFCSFFVLFLCLFCAVVLWVYVGESSAKRFWVGLLIQEWDVIIQIRFCDYTMPGQWILLEAPQFSLLSEFLSDLKLMANSPVSNNHLSCDILLNWGGAFCFGYLNWNTFKHHSDILIPEVIHKICNIQTASLLGLFLVQTLLS